MSNILLQADHLKVISNGKKLIYNVSLTLKSRQITTLIGPNGAGKSTLVKTLLGLQKFNMGHISTQANLRIGYMPQKLNIEPTLPLSVERFWQLAGTRKLTHDDYYQSLLERCRVGHLATQAIQASSGGEMQRIMLVRALLNKPNLLILDEPVQGVDINGQMQMYDLISELRDELGCGILMVSHDLHLVAAATDQVICLNQHICCSGSPDQVSQDPAMIELFGRKGASALALYNHNHNHHHDGHGTIIPNHHHAGRDHD